MSPNAFRRYDRYAADRLRLKKDKKMPPPLLQEQHPWWTIRDLNPWPPARQADALPAALIVQNK